MDRIAVLGLGAMGSRLAANLLADGREVVVWNRSPGPMAALRSAGAAVAVSPRAAARGAGTVIAMAYDDVAAEAVWLDPDTGALGAMAPGALAVDCSTLSPAMAARLHGAAAARGLRCLDAPVAGSRPQAEARALIFLVGGDADAVATAEPLLRSLGAAVHHVGGPGAGAVVKLMVNALFAAQVATLAEMIAFAMRAGVDPVRAIDALGATPVASPGAKAAPAGMLAGAFAPAAPVDLIAKDMGLATAAGASVGARLPMTEAAGQVLRAAAAEGHGALNVTAVVKRYLPESAAVSGR